MTREQAELIIKEEKLIDTDWYPSYKHSGEYHLTMWFDSDNNKYEAVYIGERG
ncbi:hypothetical protein OMM78_001860, partial [Campylobacter coli]|nr:hypothetical protein [Campylobacter coli]EIL4574441.1 hypothetical protein [Campylobacter jejuni]EHR4646878.1 hypothetical protein [Campylobacter coli]EHU8852103.1 hypothetical protein [Campylobacter coli]EIP3707870.1 hypothetical protein [Campylobacter jejuni]